jgi:formylglycine-generating enzyme required for sulfatase activity
MAGCYLVAAVMFSAPDTPLPELVSVKPGVHNYRASGEFLKDGFPVDAPMVAVRIQRPVEIMKYQVSEAEYARCVADQACEPALEKPDYGKALPVTGVSYKDARDYAKWLSGKTGENWRLPSDEEWSYAAGSRFVDDALGAQDDPGNPSTRWLLRYRKYAGLDTGTVSTVRPRGTFGANENEIHDMSGNVWEWTSTCYNRSRVNEKGRILGASTANCGVRIAEGQHRAYITFFIQDARGGGCAVGAPPDHLGFRLVKDDPAPFSIGQFRDWWNALRHG